MLLEVMKLVAALRIILFKLWIMYIIVMSEKHQGSSMPR